MGENMLSMQNPELKDWVIEVDSKIQAYNSGHKDETSSWWEERKRWDKHSIYKIPKGFGNLSRRNAYTPQMVSIGPYHHDRSQLQSMEEHKERAFHHFLAKSKKPLVDFVAALQPKAEELMGCYNELNESWQDQVKFLKLMMVDGCFLIENLRTAYLMPMDYAPDDPIFSKHGMLNNMPLIARDMLMIENQIPLLVLKILVSVEEGSMPDDTSINELVLDFFIPPANVTLGPSSLGLHVLDVVRKGMIPHPGHVLSWKDAIWPVIKLPKVGIQFKRSTTKSVIQSRMDVIWPATELLKVGIQFRKSQTQSVTDIKFEKGILWLPEIVVDDSTESKLLNITTFEHLHARAGNEVTSYVCFMGNIIRSEEDILLLTESGIMKNFTKSDRVVLELFKSLSHDRSIDPDSNLSNVHEDITAYCNKKWTRWIASVNARLKRRSGILSLYITAYGVVVSLAQLFFSILDSYNDYRKNKND